jgi:chemotaxis protein methyltransferase CheR
MGMRWGGFRKVRRQVCKRIARRIDELGLDGAQSYRSFLESHEKEWKALESLCRVTISRFYRDRGVFDTLRDHVFPGLVELAVARGDDRVRCWSGGCASGEEPYTLSIIWQHDRYPVELEIVATDADERLLERAREGSYNYSSLKDLPAGLRAWAFDAVDGRFALHDDIKLGVKFEQRDVRELPPPGSFHLVLCRNLPFTYFDDEGQRAVLGSIQSVLVPGGFLVVGVHERLPELPGGAADFEPFGAQPAILKRVTPSGPAPA